jgi:hypothetical protein
MPGEKRPSVIRRARKDTALVVKEHPVAVLLCLLIPAIPAGLASTLLPVEHWALGWRIVLGLFAAGAAGTLILLAILFLAKFVTARRHQLEDRVADLEEEVDDQREQVVLLTQDQLGERDRFIPTYYDLRTSIRDACSKVEIAMDTQVLWDRSAAFNTTPWDKNKDELGTHAWARADGIYGPCSDAFSHVKRLNAVGVFRMSRDVRPGDNLEGARDALKAAEATLTNAIGEATPSQP